MGSDISNLILNRLSRHSLLKIIKQLTKTWSGDWSEFCDLAHIFNSGQIWTTGRTVKATFSLYEPPHL